MSFSSLFFLHLLYYFEGRTKNEHEIEHGIYLTVSKLRRAIFCFFGRNLRMVGIFSLLIAHVCYIWMGENIVDVVFHTIFIVNIMQFPFTLSTDTHNIFFLRFPIRSHCISDTSKSNAYSIQLCYFFGISLMYFSLDLSLLLSLFHSFL